MNELSEKLIKLLDAAIECPDSEKKQRKQIFDDACKKAASENPPLRWDVIARKIQILRKERIREEGSKKGRSDSRRQPQR